MITTTMLQLIEQAGEDTLLLIDGLEEADFRRSRLTRHEVLQRLTLIAGTLDGLPASAQAALPEIDWPGWRVVRQALLPAGPASDDTAWFAARALVPATLSWLRVYRTAEPALFSLTPPR
jgi:uncharacterized protein with HEPN domain